MKEAETCGITWESVSRAAGYHEIMGPAHLASRETRARMHRALVALDVEAEEQEQAAPEALDDSEAEGDAGRGSRPT